MDIPFWLAEEAPPFAELALDTVDVEIVGAGITGCSCALTLAQAGKRVRVLDQRGVAQGASGRNGGFALRGGAARYDVARDTYGADSARELWRRQVLVKLFGNGSVVEQTPAAGTPLPLEGPCTLRCEPRLHAPAQVATVGRANGSESAGTLAGATP